MPIGIILRKFAAFKNEIVFVLWRYQINKLIKISLKQSKNLKKLQICFHGNGRLQTS